MNRLIRKAITLALAGVITLGMATSALASSTNTTRDENSGSGNDMVTGSLFTTAGDTIASDTATINLIKKYVANGDTAVNESTFNFKITPYGVWNAGSSTGVVGGAAYGVDNMDMPYFTSDTTNKNNNNRYTTSSITVKVDKTATNPKATVEGNAEVTLPTYKSVGDFWYLVQETVINTTGTDTTAAGNKNTGVIYGTNDAKENNEETINFNHNGTYYLHVQVVNSNSGYYRSVTLHKSAPTKNITNKAYNTWATDDNNKKNYTRDDTVKINEIENQYYAGSLSVTKAVEGNAADKDKRFEVTVVFTKPEGSIINSDITYSAVTAETGTTAEKITIVGQTTDGNKWVRLSGSTSGDSTQALTNTVKFWIKSGETVTFNNIPYGVTYTVTESDPNGTGGANNSYQNKIVVTEGETSAVTWSGIECKKDSVILANGDTLDSNNYSSNFGKYADGSITNASDTVTITNKKEVSVDIGVVLDNAPYIAMLVIIAAAAVIFFVRRKPTIEE